MTLIPPAQLRSELENATLRPHDLASNLGVPEGALVSALVGHGAVRIEALPGRLIPEVQKLGEVMALTRNRSCVIEKVGTYNDFTDGQHAAMTTDEEIDLRMFPSQWRHAFAVERPGPDGPRRSIQVFDAAGDAVHKIHLRPNSDIAAFDALVVTLALPDQTDATEFGPRAPVEGAKTAPAKSDTLQSEWVRMTDTHQFNTLVRRLGMNRLGAYRLVQPPLARELADDAFAALLERVQQTGTGIMLFVGNQGCIEIHSGTVGTLTPMGPWLNVMDARFNLHLRADHIAEVYAVEKPTKRGPAISVEAFDADGALILQCFGLRAEKGGDPDAWARLVDALPSLEQAA